LLWLPFRKQVSLRVVLGVLLVPVLACGLYWHWGASDGLLAYWRKQDNHRQALAYLKTQKSPQAVVDHFKAVLEGQPNQPKGWFLLGNIYVKQNKLELAYAAYQKAHHYGQGNTDYLSAVCQADMALHTRLAKPLYRELVVAVQGHPKDSALRYLLAFAEFNQKNYLAARKQWEQVLQQLPLESRDAKQVLALIAKTHPR